MELERTKKGALSGKAGKIIVFAAVVVLVIAAFAVYKDNREQSVDSAYLISMLEKSSELTSAKLTYTGMSEFEDSGVPFINKSNFSMVYKATARAGIDVSKIKADVDDKKKTVYITIPAAKVLDVKVEADSVRFFDKKFAPFNTDSKEDGIKAVALAEKEAEKEIADMGVLKAADAQSEALIKGLIRDAVPKEYKIEIKREK